MGLLGTQLRNALAPAARTLVSSIGRSTVQIRRAVVTRALNGSESRSWQVVSGGTALEVPITELTREAAEREWGVDAKVTAVMVITDALSIEPATFGVIVTSGDGLGQRFRVVDVQPAPIAGLNRVALQSTQEKLS